MVSFSEVGRIAGRCGIEADGKFEVSYDAVAKDKRQESLMCIGGQ